MKIESIQIPPPVDEAGLVNEPGALAWVLDDDAEALRDPGVIMVETSGPIDPQDAVLVKARNLIRKTGSDALLKSFDWAVEHGAIISEKSC